MKAGSELPGDAVVLSDSAAGDRKFSYILLVVGIACAAYGVKRAVMPLCWFGAVAFIGAALMWLRCLRRREQVVVSAAGLCVLRRSRVAGMIPADAIREVVLVEKGSALELQIKYDQAMVPVLPPAVRSFCERNRLPFSDLEQDSGREGPSAVLTLGRVSSDPAALSMEKILLLRRLVEDAGIGEWRRITGR